MSLPRHSRSPPTPSLPSYAIPQAIPSPRSGTHLLQTPPIDSHRDFSSSSLSPQVIYQTPQAPTRLDGYSSAFLPIFTLIEDATTQQHFHPKVHYIFSDDTDTPLDAFLSNTEGIRDDGAADGEQLIYNTRAIVLSLSPDLAKVATAHSLSPEWQVTGVNMGRAPQWLVGEDGAQGSLSERYGGDTEGLMLTIEGTGLPTLDAGRKSYGGQEGIYELVNTFADRMAVIKRVIEFGQMQEIEEQQEQERIALEQQSQMNLEQNILEQEEQRHLEQEGLREDTVPNE